MGKRAWIVVAVVGLVLLGGCGSKDEPLTDVTAAKQGSVALCKDGSYADNTHFDDTCNSHDGLDHWLAPFGRCQSGTIVRMSSDADCGDEGFDLLLPANYEPQAGRRDVARCRDRTFSDNQDLEETCSSRGGVDRWLSTWGVCGDDEVVKMGPKACKDHDGFERLKAAGFKPQVTEGDVAACEDGFFSDNTEFAHTCSNHGHIDHWLSTYGFCGDGHPIRLSHEATCTDHEGFDRLAPIDWRPPPPSTTTTIAPPVPLASVPPPTAPPTTALPTTQYVPPSTAPPTTTYVPLATEPAVSAGGGATAQCNDGTLSFAEHHQGACSHHGGVAVFYK